MKVFLDDERTTPEGWVRAYWPDEAIALLRTGGVQEISLDHDLGDDERGTGYDVILWMEEAVALHKFRPPVIRVHSANSSARDKMLAGVRAISQLAAQGAAMRSHSCDESLAQAYLDVLQFDSLRDVYAGGSRLSGLFLSSLPSNFDRASYRVMIVGMEPKKWRQDDCPFKKQEQPTLEAVRAAMTVHREFLAQRPGPHRFLQFFNQAKRQLQSSLPDKEVAVVWANLFCVSEGAGTPTRSTHLDRIKTVSDKLLKAQIDVVKPDAIIFTTGWRYDHFLRGCFDERRDSEAIKPKRLWRFWLGDTLCLRTSHPRYAAHNEWRAKALELVRDRLLEGVV